MNIIKIENVKRIQGFHNKVEITSEFKHTERYSVLVVLSDDDINNDNSLLKLRGYDISTLLIPKRYKYTFAETKVGVLIRPQLNKNYVISYY